MRDKVFSARVYRFAKRFNDHRRIGRFVSRYRTDEGQWRATWWQFGRTVFRHRMVRIG